MKLKKRLTHTRILSSRITSPETRENATTGKTDLLLSYADARFNHCHNVATKGVFLYAAGTNEEGDVPDGLDRLSHHKFVIHLDKDEVAVGLDVVPARVYRSGVIPASQLNVETVKLTWLVDGAVCRVIQRPSGTTADQLLKLIEELDKLATAGTDVSETTKLGNLGKIVSVSGGIVEVKMATVKRASRAPAYSNLDS